MQTCHNIVFKFENNTKQTQNKYEKEMMISGRVDNLEPNTKQIQKSFKKIQDKYNQTNMKRKRWSLAGRTIYSQVSDDDSGSPGRQEDNLYLHPLFLLLSNHYKLSQLEIIWFHFSLQSVMRQVEMRAKGYFWRELVQDNTVCRKINGFNMER